MSGKRYSVLLVAVILFGFIGGVASDWLIGTVGSVFRTDGSDGVGKVIIAQAVRIVDKTGKVRADLSVGDEEGVNLKFYNTGSSDQARLGVDGRGEASLRLASKDGKGTMLFDTTFPMISIDWNGWNNMLSAMSVILRGPDKSGVSLDNYQPGCPGMTLYDKSNAPRAILNLADGEPSLMLLDAYYLNTKKPRAMLSLSNGEPTLCLTDQDGKLRVGIGNAGQWSMNVWGTNGRSWSAP